MQENITQAGVRGMIDDFAGKLAASEPATTSAAAHAVGEIIYHNQEFYQVTAAIAVGDTLTVGTNIESTSIGLVYLEGMVTFSNLDAAISYYEDTLKNSDGVEYLYPPTGYEICSAMVYDPSNPMTTLIIPQRVWVNHYNNRIIVEVQARGSGTVNCVVKLLLNHTYA